MAKNDKPYTFVPVVFNQNNQLSVNDVTFHDGVKRDNKNRLTGNIQCTLTAKTPLLVGHYQYPASEINGVKKIKNGTMLRLPNSWGQAADDRKINDPDGAAPKSIIEPLFLLQNSGSKTIENIKNSPVLINGTSIKGMLRQTIGAMTDAPFERAADKNIADQKYFKTSDEIVRENNAKLTDVRNLFGYVDGGNSGNNNELNLGIGDGHDYARLAGRVSVNCAVEQHQDKTLSERFVCRAGITSDESELGWCNLQLKILLTPQKRKKSTVAEGRKFYRRWLPENKHFQLEVNEENKAILTGHMNQIARFVSRSGTVFRFTLRFKDLKKEELGCLLLALAPDTFKESFAPDMVDKEYWQSLGHGRPFGMGGVIIEPVTLNIFEENLTDTLPDNNMIEYVKIFMEKYQHTSSVTNMIKVMQKQDDPFSY